VVSVPDLHITPTRRRLLEDIDARRVWLDMSDDVDGPRRYWVPASTRTGRAEVSAQVAELVAAGLARETASPWKGARPWLTAAGRRALKGGGRS
jgi:hypothetical protein